MPNGSCLCGGVTFTVLPPLRPVVFCHCGQCRKTSGHYWAATRVSDAQLELQSEATLSWFQSSEKAKRGFCNRCGSSLFWRHDDDDGPAIAAGSLDAPTQLSSTKHIYCSDKGDYYTLSDELPKL